MLENSSVADLRREKIQLINDGLIRKRSWIKDMKITEEFLHIDEYTKVRRKLLEVSTENRNVKVFEESLVRNIPAGAVERTRDCSKMIEGMERRSFSKSLEQANKMKCPSLDSAKAHCYSEAEEDAWPWRHWSRDAGVFSLRTDYSPSQFVRPSASHSSVGLKRQRLEETRLHWPSADWTVNNSPPHEKTVTNILRIVLITGCTFLVWLLYFI